MSSRHWESEFEFRLLRNLNILTTSAHDNTTRNAAYASGSRWIAKTGGNKITVGKSPKHTKCGIPSSQNAKQWKLFPVEEELRFRPPRKDISFPGSPRITCGYIGNLCYVYLVLPCQLFITNRAYESSERKLHKMRFPPPGCRSCARLNRTNRKKQTSAPHLVT